MSYAVIKTGGKQYRVSEGQLLVVEKLEAESKVVFDQVLLVASEGAVKVGKPLVEGATVEAEVVSQFRGEKVRILKFRRRKHHKKQAGHRQYLTEVKITRIAA